MDALFAGVRLYADLLSLSLWRAHEAWAFAGPHGTTAIATALKTGAPLCEDRAPQKKHANNPRALKPQQHTGIGAKASQGERRATRQDTTRWHPQTRTRTTDTQSQSHNVAFWCCSLVWAAEPCLVLSRFCGQLPLPHARSRRRCPERQKLSSAPAPRVLRLLIRLRMRLLTRLLIRLLLRLLNTTTNTTTITTTNTTNKRLRNTATIRLRIRLRIRLQIRLLVRLLIRFLIIFLIRLLIRLLDDC